MGSRSEHGRLAAKVPETLAGLLGVGLADLDVRPDERSGADLVVTAGQTFVIECIKSTSAAPIAAATKKVQELIKRVRRRAVPLVAVPFMGAVGRRVCEEAGVGWLDLSGNAHIIAPGIRVIVEGRPNRFKAAGRPPNLFAPKSSRIVRWLLIHPGEPLSQRELARATGLDEGFVSRLVARLETEEYLLRDENGAVYPKAPRCCSTPGARPPSFRGTLSTRGMSLPDRGTRSFGSSATPSRSRGSRTRPRGSRRPGRSPASPCFGSPRSTCRPTRLPRSSSGSASGRSRAARTSGWWSRTTRAYSRAPARRTASAVFTPCRCTSTSKTTQSGPPRLRSACGPSG